MIDYSRITDFWINISSPIKESRKFTVTIKPPEGNKKAVTREENKRIIIVLSGDNTEEEIFRNPYFEVIAFCEIHSLEGKNDLADTIK